MACFDVLACQFVETGDIISDLGLQLFDPGSNFRLRQCFQCRDSRRIWGHSIGLNDYRRIISQILCDKGTS
jgi:hypothetical protein